MPPDEIRVSGRSWNVEVGSLSVSSFAIERHMRTCRRSSVERCSTSAAVDVGNVVGSTTSAAQAQRGIEWPAAAAWAALNRRFYYGPRRRDGTGALRASEGSWPPLYAYVGGPRSGSRFAPHTTTSDHCFAYEGSTRPTQDYPRD